jgi:hypothetical protein
MDNEAVMVSLLSNIQQHLAQVGVFTERYKASFAASRSSTFNFGGVCQLQTQPIPESEGHIIFGGQKLCFRLHADFSSSSS